LIINHFQRGELSGKEKTTIGFGLFHLLPMTPYNAFGLSALLGFSRVTPFPVCSNEIVDEKVYALIDHVVPWEILSITISLAVQS
jgi:hypothetical protein